MPSMAPDVVRSSVHASQGQELRQSIDQLFDYFRGKTQGLDIIDCAAKMKLQSDAFFNNLPPSPSYATAPLTPSLDVDRRRALRSANNSTAKQDQMMANASSALLALRNVRQFRKTKKTKRKSVRTSKVTHTHLTKGRAFAKRTMSEDDFKVIFSEVQRRGGREQVTKDKKWKQIAKCIRSADELKKQTSAGTDIKKIYCAHEERMHDILG